MTKVKVKLRNKKPTRSVSRPSSSSQSRQRGDPNARRSRASIATGADAPSSTKRDRILAMLRSASGASLSTLAEATQWQPHSVRGFLAGVVRKKLSLDLVSTSTEQGRIYRIVDKTDAGQLDALAAIE